MNWAARLRSTYGFAWVAVMLCFMQCAQDNVLSDDDGVLAVDSISPNAGVPGSQLRIYGKGFSSLSEENIVMISNLQATVDAASFGSILVSVPLQATTGSVVVTRQSQSATGPVFTITPPPTLMSIQPAQGFPGDIVTIVGAEFDQVNEVLFNGVPAVISARSETELRVTAPQSTTGSIMLSYNGGTIVGPVFKYFRIPVIESAELTIGRPSYILITGRHFSQDPASLRVLVMGTEVSIADQLLEPEPSRVLITPPDPTGENPVEITVESAGRTSTPFVFTMAPNIFTFIFDAVSSSGNEVTYYFEIEGEYFGNQGANKSVEFRHTGTGAITTASNVSWSPTFITGRFTIDPTTLGNDALGAAVVVNGVHSSEYVFRP